MGMCFRQTDQKIIDFTKCIADLFQIFTPSKLLNLLSLYSYCINRVFNRVFGMYTYIEMEKKIMRRIQAEIDEGKPDPEGNYIDR